MRLYFSHLICQKKIRTIIETYRKAKGFDVVAELSFNALW